VIGMSIGAVGQELVSMGKREQPGGEVDGRTEVTIAPRHGRAVVEARVDRRPFSRADHGHDPPRRLDRERGLGVCEHEPSPSSVNLASSPRSRVTAAASSSTMRTAAPSPSRSAEAVKSSRSQNKDVTSAVPASGSQVSGLRGSHGGPRRLAFDPAMHGG
jgi:hypothetical protein